MAEDEIETLRRQHKERMDRIDAWLLRLDTAIRFGALGVALAVALGVLTATSWQITRSGRGRNAWEVTYAIGWPAGIALALVLVLAVATLALSVEPRVPVAACWTVAVVGALTVLALLLVAALTEDPTRPTAGLWTTAVVAATLVVLHVRRARRG